jgi:salicylate 5-hydroxylase small subunit
MNKLDFDTYLALTRLYAEYAAVVDAGDWEKWIALFVDDCDYRVVPRENHERGFPLATLALISKGMLRDRAYGIKETLFHDPYYQRHVTDAPMVEKIEDGVIWAQANYAVFRTKLSQETTVFNVGRYLDRVRVTPEGLRFEQRHCIYDSELIPNSLIYPI